MKSQINESLIYSCALLIQSLVVATVRTNQEFEIERMHVEYFKLQIHGLESPLVFSILTSVNQQDYFL